jgi:phosphohistidine swiveling domain-containing protein
MTKIPNFEKHIRLLQGGRAAYFYTAYLVNKGWSYKIKKYALNNLSLVTLCKNHIEKWFFFVETRKDVENTFNAFLKDITLFDEVEKDSKKLLLEYNKKMNSINFSKLTDNQLGDLVKYFAEQFVGTLFIARSMRMIDESIMPRLKELFKNEKSVDEAVAMACACERLTFPMQEEIAVLEAAIEIKKDKSKTEKIIKRLLEKYAWVTCGYYTETPRTKEVYIQKLNDLLKDNPEKQLEEIKERQKINLKKRDELIKKYSENKKLILMTGLAGYFKDVYKSSNNEIVYRGEVLFSELARRSGKTLEFLKDLNSDELVRIAKKLKIDENIVDRRLERGVILNDKDKMIELYGKEAEEFENKYLKIENESVSEFKGRAASKGYTKAKARVVLNASQFNKMQKGEILVVINTSPDFVPIMKKASAIIAEEGGLTSHTSVVSREFGIPCVVGLHNITHLIKDGDELEVDANKGIVRILKKN